MTTISILLIGCVVIYLVWNFFELVKKITEISETNNEFNGKITEKFINLENDLLEWNEHYCKLNNNVEMLLDNMIELDKYEFKLESDKNNFERLFAFDRKIDKEIKPLIHRIANNEKSVKDNEKILESLILDNKQTSKEIKQLRENIDKDVIELNTDIQKIKKSKQKIKISDFDNLVQRVEKLEIEIAAPAFNSYKIFIAELENHKSKIKTSKGRVSLNKELIENMIKDGK